MEKNNVLNVIAYYDLNKATIVFGPVCRHKIVCSSEAAKNLTGSEFTTIFTNAMAVLF